MDRATRCRGSANEGGYGNRPQRTDCRRLSSGVLQLYPEKYFDFQMQRSHEERPPCKSPACEVAQPAGYHVQTPIPRIIIHIDAVIRLVRDERTARTDSNFGRDASEIYDAQLSRRGIDTQDLGVKIIRAYSPGAQANVAPAQTSNGIRQHRARVQRNHDNMISVENRVLRVQRTRWRNPPAGHL